jgi:hypothetical protein
MAFVFAGNAKAIDLREYMAKGVNTYVNSSGTEVARFSFYNMGNACSQYRKRAECIGWKKEYNKAGFIEATTGILAYGSDGSVGECGDKRPAHRDGGETIFYKRGNRFDCLPFANAGGLGYGFTNKSMMVGGTSEAKKSQKVFLMSRLVDHYSWYQLPDGRWFFDVIKIAVLHGSSDNGKMSTCYGKPQIRESSIAYRKIKGYNTNTSEMWFAKGIGMIKSDKPYVENAVGLRGGTTERNTKPCYGYMFDNKDRAMYLK